MLLLAVLLDEGDNVRDHALKDSPMLTPECPDRSTTSVKLPVHFPSKNAKKTLVGSFQSVGVRHWLTGNPFPDR